MYLIGLVTSDATHYNAGLPHWQRCRRHARACNMRSYTMTPFVTPSTC